MLRKWGTKYAAMLQFEKFQSSQQFGDGYTTSTIYKEKARLIFTPKRAHARILNTI